MKDECLKEVKNFLDRYLVDERPILLAISGGTDSLSLLYLLLAARQFHDLNLHLAHVDHCLRPESGAEAHELAVLARSLDLPFHQKRLKHPPSHNVEDWARQMRYAFFREVYQAQGCQALITAHHQNDQAETVLKRLFEGARLPSLGALAPETVLLNMRVWRPLLSVDKKQLEAWLGRQGFDDPMNQDPHYLRARMRRRMFPILEQEFGKKISPTLARLGERGRDLRDYLNRRTRRYFHAIERCDMGLKINFEPFFPLEKVEVMHFLHEWTRSLGVTLSHEEEETVFKLLKLRTADRQVGPFRCSRGVLTYMQSVLAHA